MWCTFSKSTHLQEGFLYNILFCSRQTYSFHTCREAVLLDSDVKMHFGCLLTCNKYVTQILILKLLFIYSYLCVVEYQL